MMYSLGSEQRNKLTLQIVACWIEFLGKDLSRFFRFLKRHVKQIIHVVAEFN